MHRQRGAIAVLDYRQSGMQEGVVEQNRKHLFSRDGGANRHHAAARAFATQNIRLHIFVLTGKHLAGTPHAGLYLHPESSARRIPSQSLRTSVGIPAAAGSRRLHPE